jgi:hypothetical protein
MNYKEQIKHWSLAVGLPCNEMYNPNFNLQLVKQHINHIREELSEVEYAFNREDYNAYLDGLGDVVWVVERLKYIIGMHPKVESGYSLSNGGYTARMTRLAYEEMNKYYIPNTVVFINNILNCIDDILNYITFKDDKKHIALEALIWSLTSYTFNLTDTCKYNVNKGIDIIYKSNMTKLCTEREVNESLKGYLSKGVIVNAMPSHTIKEMFYLVDDKGKVRKPDTYIEPDWNKYR